ncbi:MAG: BRCT domain-containing protein [Deltaproteobacteria bacterium]|nr:BRCT domain-containing protein [Deltaproteobacteria bacterium]
MTRACAETGLGIEEWLTRVRKLIFPPGPQPSSKREGNVDGPLFGETVVFTGKPHMPRARMADMVAEAGCNVASGVSKKVTTLVVESQDRTKLKGYERSSKHRKAEALMAQGLEILIPSETDFPKMT